jgi:uncharacterized protein YciI
MQFLVVARDGTDLDAPARRAAARPAHLAGILPLVEAGTVVIGGAMLDEAGGMTGSAVIYEAPDRAAVEALIAADPYTSGKVWQDVTITPFRVAVQAQAK